MVAQRTETEVQLNFRNCARIVILEKNYAWVLSEKGIYLFLTMNLFTLRLILTSKILADALA